MYLSDKRKMTEKEAGLDVSGASYIFGQLKKVKLFYAFLKGIRE